MEEDLVMCEAIDHELMQLAAHKMMAEQGEEGNIKGVLDAISAEVDENEDLNRQLECLETIHVHMELQECFREAVMENAHYLDHLFRQSPSAREEVVRAFHIHTKFPRYDGWEYDTVKLLPLPSMEWDYMAPIKPENRLLAYQHTVIYRFRHPHAMPKHLCHVRIPIYDGGDGRWRWCTLDALDDLMTTARCNKH